MDSLIELKNKLADENTILEIVDRMTAELLANAFEKNKITCVIFKTDSGANIETYLNNNYVFIIHKNYWDLPHNCKVIINELHDSIYWRL